MISAKAAILDTGIVDFLVIAKSFPSRLARAARRLRLFLAKGAPCGDFLRSGAYPSAAIVGVRSAPMTPISVLVRV
jgi:hypothetical protein